MALAELYLNHPEYLQLQIVQSNASALNPSDKIIFTPEGTIPTLVMPGPGIVPTVDTTSKVNTSAALSNQSAQTAAAPEVTSSSIPADADADSTVQE